mmetsp:Transcript_34919/g.96425  ORF Transcript_34919/g.96425 Transcript_34919/m.96425 type:complete len:745 (-) Transcript_34919:97-2331(-)
MAPESNSVPHVTFRLGCAESALGEHFVVVGSHDALGSWDPDKGLRLDTDEKTYPSWTASVSLPLQKCVQIEYKYVRSRTYCGDGFLWEHGENRVLVFPPGEASGGVWEKFDEALGMQSATRAHRVGKEHYDMTMAGPLSDEPPTTEGSEQDRRSSTASVTKPDDLVNFPSAVSVGSGNDIQRLASFSALGQLINDANGMLELRARMESEVAEVDNRPVRYGARHLSTPIVIVSSEMHPWSKTGGLAMIAGSYAYEFALRGHRTMAIAPMYDDYAKCTCIGSKAIELVGGWHEVRYFHQQQTYGPGKMCDYIFVDHPCYRRGGGIYGPPDGEYEDNLFRFALFSLAAAEAPLILEINGSTYGQDVLFICNDWQTGILPVYLLYKYKFHRTYENARSVIVIHNIGYQGKYSKGKYPVDTFLGLPRHLAGNDLQGEDMHLGHDCINLLAGGLRTADRVLTVSPNYAIEIQSPEGGHGLHDLLRKRGEELRLGGILNGISDEWHPATDPHIARNYRVSNFVEGKSVCKAALQKELGLNQDPRACLIGFCGRLCYQKGLKLIMDSIEWLMQGQEHRCQVVLMGKGEPCWAEQVAQAEHMYRGRVCGYVGFDPHVEHRMMAGCDIFLMPSQYEPCGLPQMYAQMYGTIPVVHETGGLKDSVKGLWDESRDRNTATGFIFCGFTDGAMRHELWRAMSMYHQNPDLFHRMQENAMCSNYYWPSAMDEYERHIDYTMEAPVYKKPESWWTNHL